MKKILITIFFYFFVVGIQAQNSEEKIELFNQNVDSVTIIKSQTQEEQIRNLTQRVDSLEKIILYQGYGINMLNCKLDINDLELTIETQNSMMLSLIADNSCTKGLYNSFKKFYNQYERRKKILFEKVESLEGLSYINDDDLPPTGVIIDIIFGKNDLEHALDMYKGILKMFKDNI